MGMESVHSNFTAGALAPELHSRVDLDKYQHGCSVADNVVILSYGGLKRRDGLAKVGRLSASGRMFAFSFNSKQNYLLVFGNLKIDIYHEEKLVKTVTTTITTDMVADVDITQSGDTLIVCHEGLEPYKLLRGDAHDKWTYEKVTFKSAPKEWTAANGYPSCCTFYGNRLWFASSKKYPTSIWGSKVNGFFDFDVGNGDPDLGIFDTLDSNTYNKILNLVAGRDLCVMTTGDELYNVATPITPNTSSYKIQTSYGSKNIPVESIDGSLLYVDSSGRNIRQFLFSFNEDAYTSANISLLSSHLINDVRSMAVIKGTQYNTGDYLYVVNGDGTVAVMNSMRHENIQGWTRFITKGNFKDVCVVGKEVYFMVERYGKFFIEKLQNDTYTDHNVTSNDSNRVITNYDGVFANDDFKVIADLSIMPDTGYVGSNNANTITCSRNAKHLEVGLNFDVMVKTLPLATMTQKGSTLFRRQRVTSVKVNVLESLGVNCRDVIGNNRDFTIVLDNAPIPFSGFKEIFLLGYDRMVVIEISQNQPLPMTLISLGYSVDY